MQSNKTRQIHKVFLEMVLETQSKCKHHQVSYGAGC